MTPPRPEALEVRPRHIPQALKEVRGWVMWRWYLKGGKWTKPPLNIEGVKIDITSPDNWCDFTTALQAYQRGQFDGIGFSLGAMDSLGGVDLDHCIQGGKIEPWALEIIEELGSYAEISPSGTGVRVFGLTPRVVEGRKKDNIEMYVDGRYLTVTGCRLDNSASDLVDFDEAFGAVYDRAFPDSPESEDFDPTTDRGEVGEDLAERFQAFCEDDPTFKDRFNSPAAVGDRSGAEFHLCAKLWEAGFTFDEIWQLMDSSPQTKWRSREDAYKERTIRKAISAARSSEKDRGRGEISTEEGGDGIESITEEELNGLNLATRPKLYNRLEPDNFISEYLEFGAATCDAYQEYHYSGAITLLSAAVGRKLVIKLKQGPIHPNIWSFNLGPSTISRKSTALAKMEDMLKVVCPYTAIPKSFSPEALIEFLSECPVAYLVKDEVGQLLASMRKQYMEDVRDFFSEIYDNRDFRRKLRTGKRKDKTDFQITDPYIVQSYATTNTLFREYTTPLDLTSGWLLRFLYFAPNYKKPSMAFEVETGTEAELYGRSLGRFSALHRLFSRIEETEIEIEPEAMKFYQEWQLSTENALMEENDEGSLAMWGRLQVYALKLAVLFTVGKKGYQVGDKISLAYMTEAVRQVDEYFLPVGRSVAEEVGRAEQTNLQNKIIGTLERHGGKMKRPALLKSLHVRLKDISEALDALTESEEIEIRKEVKEGRKTAIWYLLVNNRNHRNNPNNPINRNNRLDSTFDPGIDGNIAMIAINAMIATNAKKGEKGGGEEVAGDSEPEPYETISETLEEGERRQEEEAEKFKTPEPAERSAPKKDVERPTAKNAFDRSNTKKETPEEKPSLSEPALKTLLDESGEITPERYVAQAGGTPGAAIRQLDLACAVYGWKKRKVGFSVIYGPGVRA
ncbi:MAG: DUF3987 domain-containing protein [Methanothrix sp.]|nr:DUF3987 domain-containing protein [Methanothrix sp.]